MISLEMESPQIRNFMRKAGKYEENTDFESPQMRNFNIKGGKHEEISENSSYNIEEEDLDEEKRAVIGRKTPKFMKYVKLNAISEENSPEFMINSNENSNEIITKNSKGNSKEIMKENSIEIMKENSNEIRNEITKENSNNLRRIQRNLRKIQRNSRKKAAL